MMLVLFLAINVTPNFRSPATSLTWGSLLHKEGKTIPVTGRGGPWGCKTLKLPHFLDSRLTDGGKVVSLTRLPPFTPRKIRGIISVRG
jgi:hypothetical protein